MVEQNRQPGESEESCGEQVPVGRSARMMWGLRALGLIVVLVVWIAMGFAEGLSSGARWVVTVATLMAIWWMAEAIPLSATALLPNVLIPMLMARTVGEATAPYASSIVFLFLGGFLIAIALWLSRVDDARRAAALHLYPGGLGDDHPRALPVRRRGDSRRPSPRPAPSCCRSARRRTPSSSAAARSPSARWRAAGWYSTSSGSP